MLSINTLYNIGQEVCVTPMNGKTYRGKIHMIRAEWNPYGAHYHYDIAPSVYYEDLEDCDNYLADMAEEWIKPIDNEEIAREELAKMTLEECISMWNQSAVDNYRKSYEIHEMDDEH